MTIVRVEYAENKDVAHFNGFRFRRDKKTGYYLSSLKIGNRRKRLHNYVWEYFNGKPPKGFHVHHKTHDKYDNDIEHLELMGSSKHLSLHSTINAKSNQEWVAANLRDNAQPKAVEWHKSEEGRDWHREHYDNMKDKLHSKELKECNNCGQDYVAKTSFSKFCSNKCKSAHRRKSGVDNIVKLCEKCGEEYIANKYQNTKYCKVCKN